MGQRGAIDLINSIRKKSEKYIDNRLSYIAPFYSVDNNCFAYRLGESGGEKTIHITSSATCAMILEDWSSLDIICPDKEVLITKLINSEWKTTGLPVNNPYTVAVTLYPLMLIGADASNARIEKGINILIEAINITDGGITLTPDYRDTENAFITYWALSSLDLYDHKTGKNGRIGNSISKAVSWAKSVLYQQIAYYHTGNSELLNAHQLAYSWAICKRFGEEALLHEIDSLILSIIFNSQDISGVWRKRTPLFSWSSLGVAYVYHFELMMAVLIAVEDNYSLLMPYLDHLMKLLNWVETNELKVKDSKCGGWSIEGDPLARLVPLSWATAEVLYVLSKLDKLLALLYRDIIFETLVREKPFTRKISHKIDQILDMDIYDKNTTILQEIKNKIIDPISDIGGTLINSDDGMCLSVFFFGPPGSSKTTIAEAVANELNWPLLEIDPSHFVPRKGAGLEMRVIEVFSYLENLIDTVILLDEMDELVRVRDDDKSDRIGRLWTTLMLPRLTKLRKKKSCIIFGTTNYIDVIDKAAIRPGRFDMVLPVGPPQRNSKLQSLARHIKNETSELNEWLENLDRDRQDIFDQLLYGELMHLIRMTKRIQSKEEFSSLLFAMQTKVHLSQEREDGVTYWQEFTNSCNKYTRMY